MIKRKKTSLKDLETDYWYIFSLFSIFMNNIFLFFSTY